MHVSTKFNVKGRQDFDKEFSIGQMYQFEFKKNFIKDILESQKAPATEVQKRERETQVKYPNKVYMAITCNRDCYLEVVAQLSLQPEPPEEKERRLKELETRKKNIDFDALAQV